jgi:hypothetical protein
MYDFAGVELAALPHEQPLAGGRPALLAEGVNRRAILTP